MPDQSGFLEQWYNWHRRYRTVKHDDGREERQALLGERLEDTLPGYFPRTLNELRAGTSRESAAQHFEESHALAHPTTSNTSLTANTTEPDTTIEIDPEDRIFDLPSPAPDTQPTSITPYPTSRDIPEPQGATVDRAYEATYRAGRIEYRTRRIASLRRELQRLRVSIDRVASGLRELGDQVPDSGEARNHSLELDSRLQTLEQRLSSTRGRPVRDLNPAAMDSAQRQEYLRQLWTSREITRDPATEIASHDRQMALLSSRNNTTQQTSNALDVQLDRVGDAAGDAVRPIVRPAGGYSPGYVPRALRRPNFGRFLENATAHEASSAPIPIPHYGSHTNIDTPEGMVLQPHNEAPNSAATEPAYVNRVQAHGTYLIDQVRTAQLQRDRIKREYDVASEQLRRLRELQAQYVVSMRQREEAAHAAQIHEQNVRLFGTAEDVERQGADYESPISGLFNPYYSRFRAREDTRRRGETPQTEQHGSRSETGRLDAQGRAIDDQLAAISASTGRDFNLRPYGMTGGAAAMRDIEARNDAESPGIIPPDNIVVRNAYGGINFARMYSDDGTDVAIEWTHQRRALGDDDFYGHSSDEGFNGGQRLEGTRKGLDKDDGRPEPLKDEDLSVKLECKICFSQLASVMVLPCGKPSHLNVDY